MKHSASVDLFQYWDRLRAGRAAPRRTEIEPADIKSLLADTFILEQDSRGEAIFRLAGTRLCAIFGRELKGFSFPSLWTSKDQRLVARLANSAFHPGNVIIITFQGLSTQQRRNAFELLLLPLDSADESPRMLGIATAAARPFWLGADPLIECAVETIRIVDPDREPLFLKNRPAVAVPSIVPSASALMETPPTRNGRRIRHLVVLEGGRGEQGEAESR
ncbi:MAG TPA: PAS domain-containing protein [Rhizobiaceae bacterium]|nr:PAS domain-containing protein [Rhizobiaceae bacterium]